MDKDEWVAVITNKEVMAVKENRVSKEVVMALAVKLEVDKDLEAAKVNKAVAVGPEVKVVRVVTLAVMKVELGLETDKEGWVVVITNKQVMAAKEDKVDKMVVMVLAVKLKVDKDGWVVDILKPVIIALVLTLEVVAQTMAEQQVQEEWVDIQLEVKWAQLEKE